MKSRVVEVAFLPKCKSSGVLLALGISLFILWKSSNNRKSVAPPTYKGHTSVPHLNKVFRLSIKRTKDPAIPAVEARWIGVFQKGFLNPRKTTLLPPTCRCKNFLLTSERNQSPPLSFFLTPERNWTFRKLRGWACIVICFAEWHVQKAKYSNSKLFIDPTSRIHATIRVIQFEGKKIVLRLPLLLYVFRNSSETSGHVATQALKRGDFFKNS